LRAIIKRRNGKRCGGIVHTSRNQKGNESSSVAKKRAGTSGKKKFEKSVIVEKGCSPKIRVNKKKETAETE